MQEQYNHQQIEKKIQQKWLEHDTFKALEDSNLPKYYCLSMFAYPSGSLHMGHVRNYAIGDVFARFYKLCGYNVMQPFGWDSFGLPAENAAIQNNVPPATWTYQNINHMKEQIQAIGLAVDWSREITTCKVEYYKWQQWLFIKLYQKGLIYKKNGTVNWDPIDQTVLANEQVIDGKGWRSGAIIEKRQIPMYYVKITSYARELLADLDKLDGWPNQVKTMQKNWIGKSHGVEVYFGDKLKVFTTRIDTLMGVSYIAISTEHSLVNEALQLNPSLADELHEYRQGGVSELDLVSIEKKGIFSGLYVTHPVTQEQIPVWIANYVLANYGFGAVMGVPAHDKRDFDFAKKYNLAIKPVIRPLDNVNINDHVFTNQGILFNSNQFNGLTSEIAIKLITKFLVSNNLGHEKINYRLRDWGISRQRYWGCPIPIIYCDNCGEILVNESDLPVKLPEDVSFDSSVPFSLKNISDFYEVDCPKCGAKACRETDTMDTFVDSSWYFLRYASFDATENILDSRVNYWAPIDQYVGGIEHAILHLLYARFFHKALRDLSLVNSSEPFTNLLTQGMVLAQTYYQQKDNGQKIWFNSSNIKIIHDEKNKPIKAINKIDGTEVIIGNIEKMSKSKNNGVNPQEIIKHYGADTARLFILFAAPPELALEWSDSSIEGANRFIKRLWRFVYEHLNTTQNLTTDHLTLEQNKLYIQLHKTVFKVTNDIKIRKQFNTAIASIMELLNLYSKTNFYNQKGYDLAHEVLKSIIIMLSPITPHVCEELWQYLLPEIDIWQYGWIKLDESALNKTQVEMIIQVNGKVRGKIIVDKSMSNEQIEQMAKANFNVQKIIAEKEIKKIIIVANKIVNIVV